MTAAKAVWAAVLSFLAPAAAILIIEIAGDGIQSDDVWKALLVAIVTAAPTSATVYAVKNKPKE
jgi:hypothetical protein